MNEFSSKVSQRFRPKAEAVLTFSALPDLLPVESGLQFRLLFVAEGRPEWVQLTVAGWCPHPCGR